MANFFKHSVKITPVEQQQELPFDWYPHSAYNASSFGGTYHASTNISTIHQFDDRLVLEADQGSANIIYDVVLHTQYNIVFLAIQNTGDNDILLKFDKITPIDHSGYSWYLGVNEIWATSIPTGASSQGWERVFAKGIDGHSKVSFMVGIHFTGGG